MRFRQYWMWVIVIAVLLGSSGCGLLDEGGDRADAPATGRQDRAETAAPCAEGICGGGPESQAPANPDGSRDGFTWLYDCSEAGCSTTGEGIPVGFIPVSCSEWPCPTQNCGEGEAYDATCPQAPTSTITPEGSVTLTPTPYTFATHCGACMPTEIPDYDYINTWDEFTTLLSHYIEKYVYFPVTVYHRVNEYEFIAIWGDADNYNQGVWVQLQKDGSQRTDGFYPGMRVMVYGQISLDQGCTDDLSAGMICFPAVIGSSVAER